MLPLDLDPLKNEAERKFCVLKNKQMKWYKDGQKMMNLEGIIDFDLVKCVVLIMQPTECSMPCTPVLTPVRNTQKFDFDQEIAVEPTKFSISVEGC